MRSRPRRQIQPRNISSISMPIFITLVVFTIILALLFIIFLYLYIRDNRSKIKPENCQSETEGRYLAGKDVSSVSANCGVGPQCTFTVNSLSQAQQQCRDIGTAKCQIFSLTPNGAGTFTMKASSSTDTVDSVVSDVYFR